MLSKKEDGKGGSMMSKTTAFVAIIIAQLLVVATLHFVRRKRLWQKKASAGLVVFGLEVVYVFICLGVASFF
jgi:hypothetical protein